jgi:hypothetical protein
VILAAFPVPAGAQQNLSGPPISATEANSFVSDPANVLESGFGLKDWEPNADPLSPQWSGTPFVTASRGFFGEAVALPPTEIRSRWTHKYLYLLFVCPYHELYLKPNPVNSEETNKLWDWDVAEAFIGSDYLRMSRYKEFQISPQGEYVDLDIDQDEPKSELQAIGWQSGFVVRARIDARKKAWYGEMRIPFASLEAKNPAPGDEFRLGLFRIEGPAPHRMYVSWRATGARTFHVPGAFGSLVLK